MTYLGLTSIYTHEYTRRIVLTKKRAQHLSYSQGDDASTAEVRPGRVRRDEHGEARRANTTPNGGPHLELLWSVYGSKPGLNADFSIAGT